MKRMVGVVIMCVLMLPLLAFGGREKTETVQLQQVTVVGQIGVYGNEPHTWLGFVDQQGVEYALDATADVLQELQKMQGLILEITGELDAIPEGQPVGFQALSGGTLHVEEFKPHTSKS